MYKLRILDFYEMLIASQWAGVAWFEVLFRNSHGRTEKIIKSSGDNSQSPDLTRNLPKMQYKLQPLNRNVRLLTSQVTTKQSTDTL
jgi:hypothetical protein